MYTMDTPYRLTVFLLSLFSLLTLLLPPLHAQEVAPGTAAQHTAQLEQSTIYLPLLRSSGAPPTTPATRDPLLWPFAQDSIWNMPIGADARYVPAGITSQGLQTDIDWLVVSRESDPELPVYMPGEFWPRRCRGTTPQQQAQWHPEAGAPIHVPVDLLIPEPDKAWNPNSSSAFLKPDGRTLVSFNATARCEPGGPVYGVWFGEQDLYGDGIDGGHGGSGMSSIGGSIRPGELFGDEPIRHALKLNIGGEFMFYDPASATPGYRWPARLADSYAPTGYTGQEPALEMGALLAIPPNVTAEQLGLQTAVGKKLFAAFRDYGAYVVDDSGGSNLLCVEQAAYEEYRAITGRTIDDDTSLDGDMTKLMAALHVVDNNGPNAIGGGGARRAPLAPPFSPMDTQAPSAPAELQTTELTLSRAELTWQPARDNVRVVSYAVFVDGSYRGSAFGTPRFTLEGLAAGTTYSIAVEARDVAQNRSSQAVLSVTTPPQDARHYEERFATTPVGWELRNARVADGRLELANWGGTAGAIFAGRSFPSDGGQRTRYSLGLAPVGTASGNRTLVYFHYRDNDNTYWVEIGGGPSGAIELRKRIGGVETLLGQANQPWLWRTLIITATADGAITVAGRAAGETTTLLTATDTALTGGNFGIGARSNTVYVDDVWVEVQ